MISSTNISTKKRFIIVGLSFLVISLLILFMWLLTDTEKQKGFKDEAGDEKYLIEELGIPKVDWQRKIDIKKDGGTRTITNIYDGYRISISDEWEVVEEVRTGLFGLVLLYGQKHEERGINEEEHPYISDGLVVNVFIFENTNKLSLIDWLVAQKRKQGFFKNAEFKKVQHSLYEILKTQEPLFEDVWLGSDNFTDALIEDTLSIRYVIKAAGVDTIYVVSCTIYNDVTKLVPRCEEVVPFFEILN